MKTVYQPEEPAYLAMLAGARELFCLPDICHGGTEAEIKDMVAQTARRQDCQPAFSLADSGLALRMKWTRDRALNFAFVGCEAAKQTAAAFIGGDFYV